MGWQSHNLFVAQKKAIRIITKSRYNAHTNILFKQLNTLKIQDICALHDYTFCYKLINRQAPDFFMKLINPFAPAIHDHNTRHATDLRLPAFKHEFARNSIKYRFPNIFNDMEDDLKEKFYTHSLFGFKFYFKRTVLESYPSV